MAFVGDNPFFYKKSLAFFYGAKLIFRSFATFFGPTVFTSGAKQKLLFPQSISVLDQNAINDSPDYPAEGRLNSELIYEVIVSPKMPNKNLKDFCPTL